MITSPVRDARPASRRRPVDPSKYRCAIASAATPLSAIRSAGARPLCRSADHSGARGVGPGHERVVRLLRLGRQDEDVVNIQLDFLRPADRRGGQGDVFIGHAAGDHAHAGPPSVHHGLPALRASGQSEPTAQSSANRSSTKNDVARHVPHRNLAQL